jgi:Fe(II)/alpha-ketoglutarate-dependent arginine beta-hydroxylase
MTSAAASRQRNTAQAPAQSGIRALVLTDRERRSIARLARQLTMSGSSTDDPGLYERLALTAHRLPQRLREFLLRFRLDELAGVALIRGLPLPVDPGPTPSIWRDEEAKRRTVDFEVALLLCGSVIGDPFAWATQQAGALVNDVIPVTGYEDSQVGAGSLTTLKWHTEDAFHPCRAEWLALACLRNPDHVATTVAHVEDALPAVQEPDELFEECVFIGPDDAHKPDFKQPADAPLTRDSLAESRSGRRTAVLSGPPHAPELCVDPAYMEILEPGSPAAEAVDELCAGLDAALKRVVLEPGDALFIDNRRAVHGRAPFRARYDGTDRWLKRINLMRDIRRAGKARIVDVPPTIF